jgi:hypothetical protein
MREDLLLVASWILGDALATTVCVIVVLEILSLEVCLAIRWLRTRVDRFDLRLKVRA